MRAHTYIIYENLNNMYYIKLLKINVSIVKIFITSS